MGKVLKLGFAMGGGVSLGTFSGVALAEAMKLALLRGRSAGEPFESVEVDVFSGASAGAMSLGIMLRSLVNRTAGQSSRARLHLEAQFGAEFHDQPDKIQKHLVAAQVLQDTQIRVWTEEISLRQMLRDDLKPYDQLKYKASLLNRSAVDEIARKHVDFPKGVVLSGRRILADRVLFACALSNLTPMVLDARKEFGTDAGSLLGLNDGLRSKTHRDLRVFDLYFKEIPAQQFSSPEAHPQRWCRYHAGARTNDVVGSLNERKTWAKIAATSIASGAFPIAFEPVILNRKRFEYGNQLWPKELADKMEHPFTFVDGGFYNNEPIREAFRLASFMDAQDPRDIVRRIIFVDPYVAPGGTDLTVGVHQQFAIEDPNLFGSFDGYDLERLTTIDRLIPQVGSLIGATINQATGIEGDKVFKTRKRFELRDGVRRALGKLLTDAPPLQELKALQKFCADTLKRDRMEMTIPPGAVTVHDELERVIREQREELAPIRGQAEAFIADMSGAEHKDLWVRALAYVSVDLVMNLSGKSRDSGLIAIGPVLNPGPNAKIVTLPGAQLAAFGGFMSKPPNRFAVELARRCAQQFMEAGGLVAERPLGKLPEWTDADKEEYRKDLILGLESLADRIQGMIAEYSALAGLVLPLGRLLFAVKKKLRAFAEDSVENADPYRPPTTRFDKIPCEFRIQVADKSYELDGSDLGFADISPIAFHGKRYLITTASYERKSDRWVGEHIGDDGKHIPVDRAGLIDRRFCTIELPDQVACAKAAMLPYAVFEIELKKSDEDGEVGNERWSEPFVGIPSLEDTVFDSIAG